MQALRRPLIAGLLFGLMLSIQGCALFLVGAGAGAGAGTVAYVKGELQSTYAASLDRTWNATMTSLKEMNITIQKEKKDSLGGEIDAVRADGTAVKIAVAPAGQGTTTVKIRIGIFGDKDGSEAINRRIAQHLKG